MPLTAKGKKILSHMRQTYKGEGGEKKAKSVFYASINAGKIKGAEKRQGGGKVLPQSLLPENPSPPISPYPWLVPPPHPPLSPGKPGEKLKARGGRVCPTCGGTHAAGDPHEQREKQLIGELAAMNRHRAEGGDVKPLPIAREAVSIVPPTDPDVERLRHVLQGYKGLPSTYRSPWNQPMGKARGGHIDTQRLTAMMSHMRDRAVHKAAGGYIVGERGPEYFMPDHSGTIIPHHELDRLARKYGGRISNKRKR